jgi:hypothetical protein
MLYDTQSPSYRLVVRHGDIGKYNLEASLSGCNPGIYCLAYSSRLFGVYGFYKTETVVSLLSKLGHSNNGGVQAEQAVQATDLESGKVVDIIGVQLVQGINILCSCRLARRQ